MEAIKDFLIANDSTVPHKISQTLKFGIGAVATAGLVWLKQYPALVAAAAAAGGLVTSEQYDEQMKNCGLYSLLRGATVMSIILASANLIKALEVSATRFETLSTLCLKGAIPIGLNFMLYTSITTTDDAKKFLSEVN